MTAENIAVLRGELPTLRAGADAFLSSARMANPNTHRAYASVIDRMTGHLGPGRLLASVADGEIGDVLEVNHASPGVVGSVQVVQSQP
jgi:hypothetical protein